LPPPQPLLPTPNQCRRRPPPRQPRPSLNARAPTPSHTHTHEQLDLPLLAFHSERDTMTDPASSRLVMERSSSADKTLVRVDHMWCAR
jgi:alpha-beta hydrolase superfamily lysophospholipase